MSIDVLLALVGFAFASSITPGPNNMMLLASGVNYGLTRSIPHMLGISGGFGFLLLCVGLGLGQLLEAAPVLYTVLKIAGAAYLVYLAWRIANSGSGESASSARAPMSFFEAAAFQWVNPKAWMMAVTSMTLYTSTQNYMASVLFVVVVFTLVNLPSVAVWCGMGLALKRQLSDPGTLKFFNITMALLLVASLWPMLS